MLAKKLFVMGVDNARQKRALADKGHSSAWVDPDGYLHIGGRIKEQYKLENGTPTQTMKLKRRVVLDQFESQIETL